MMLAASRDELTEALCLLPPVQRAFETSIKTLKERLAGLPKEAVEIPSAVQFPPLEHEGRRVPMYAVGWFSGAVALALIASFAAGFITGAGS